MVNPYKLIAGLGVATRGVGAADDVPYRWPNDRVQGLTFGELQTIDSWLRNYLLPPCWNGNNSGVKGPPGATDWYASAHYASLKFQPTGTAARNELGETAPQAWAKIEARWNSLQLANKDQLQHAYNAVRDAYKPFNHLSANWPMQKPYVDLKPQKLLDHIRHWSNGGVAGTLDPWFRFVAAMAIGRDLFAEKFEEIGGVQLGLQDTIADLQESGTAIKGRWEALAGRWAWKGIDLQGRPLLASAPLIPPPVFAPQDAEFTRGRNSSIWNFIADLLASASDGQVAIAQLVPVLTGQFNQLARLTLEPEIAAPPATAKALGQLFASYYNLLGLDVYRQLRDYGGEDLANVLRDEAAARYPVATAALFEAAI